MRFSLQVVGSSSECEMSFDRPAQDSEDTGYPIQPSVSEAVENEVEKCLTAL